MINPSVLGNCIGRHNHPHFIFLLSFSAIACTCAAASVWLHLKESRGDAERWDG